MQHGPHAEIAAAGVNVGECAADLVLLDFSKETERTQVDAQNGNACFGDAACGRKQRAVTAQYDHEIRLGLDQVVALYRFTRGAKFPRNGVCE